LVLLVIGERLLNPVIDLAGSLFTNEQLSSNALVLGTVGIIVIIAATILGVLLVQHAYTWIRAANRAMQGTRVAQEMGQQPSKLAEDQFSRFPVTRIEVKEKIFVNQDVYLDGHSWNKCTFKNCNIIVERGDFDAVNCTFDSCRLTAKGGAIAILKIAKGFFPQIPIKEPSVGELHQSKDKQG